MIIALFALSVAMIVGGLLSAILGWDIVLVERGWTMVLAGSISAASGAILLGITAAVSKLAKIQAELMRLHAGLNEAEPELLPETASGLSLAALAGGLFGGGALGAASAEKKSEEQPSLPFPPMDISEKDTGTEHVAERPEETPVETVNLSEDDELSADLKTFLGRSSSPAEEAPEPKVPDFLIAERYRETVYTEVRVSEPEETLHALEPANEALTEVAAGEPETVTAPDAGEEDAGEEPKRDEAHDLLEPEPLEPVSEAEPDAQAEAVEEAAPAGQRSASTVIGTYNSGDNKYVMFSDGSIEAQTPQGVFHFKSLDELKEFIASGGESGQTPAT